MKDNWIVGWNRDAHVILTREESSALGEMHVQSLKYVVLPYRGERFDTEDGKYRLSRVVFLSGLKTNLTLYQVDRVEYGMSHAEFFERIVNNKTAYVSVVFLDASHSGLAHRREDRLWSAFTDKDKPILLNSELDESSATFVFHDAPLRATHFVLQVFAPHRFEPIADFILTLTSRTMGETDEFHYAFIPIADIGYVRMMDESWYAQTYVFWCSVKMSRLLDSFRQSEG